RRVRVSLLVSLRRRTGSQSRLRRELVNSSVKLWSMSALGQKQTYAVQHGMSALGQKQTYAVQHGMSPFPPKADMCGAAAHVCFGLQCNTACPLCPRKRTCAVRQPMSVLGQKRTRAGQHRGSLFDQLVGDREKIRRDIEAERFGGCEVDDEIDLACQLNRHIGGRFPLLNSARVDAGAAVGLGLGPSLAP